MTISFKESIAGCHKTLFLKKNKRCPACYGTRCMPGTMPSKCWGCYGKGIKIMKVGPFLEEEECESCGGIGMTIKMKCPECKGEGIIQSEEP